ncbi:MAG: hypothetical protein NZ480_09740 [Bdellovibrionaceae bacterium]|nr:hypothetical protein [Pseudobdellovibrionaceae bacterium]MDW8190050.1 hypothetical protein [Pseudobdellovibrionaceae bacterium]
MGHSNFLKIIDGPGDVWSPDANIWLTRKDQGSGWWVFFDYKLNFIVSRNLLHRFFSVPHHVQERYLKFGEEKKSDKDFVSSFFAVERMLTKNIEIYPTHGMLPCELLVLISDKNDLVKLMGWNFGFSPIIVRCFGFSVEEFESPIFSKLKEKYIFQLVVGEVFEA